MNQFNSLKLTHVSEAKQLVGQDFLNLSINVNSNAEYVYHGFQDHPPLYIEANTDIDESLMILSKTHHNTCFVVDKSNQLMGLVSKAILNSSQILKIANRLKITRKDINIEDVMINVEQLLCIEESKLVNLTVGDIVKTMESNDIEYLLVIDQKSKKIRGYFDLLKISQSLGNQFNQVHKVHSFSDIVNSLKIE